MIRILFVDDEESVCHAMRRAMHCMRHEWEMEFVLSGEAALASLAKSPADVIVSDMRMPGMDGWQLLGEVKRLYPQTARLVLSGHAEPGAIMRLVGSAHQYIGKPGESETLKAAIAQTQLMKGLLSNASLASLVGQVGTLPSFPQAFTEITRCLQRPNATVADAARIISRDVAMTANIMKLVNSAFFGIPRSIASVDRAVAYLGLDTLTALVLGYGLFQSNGSSALEGIWQHSLRTATAARAIALKERLPRPRVDEAFLGGMLHDVGRVVFATRGGAAEAHCDVDDARAAGSVGRSKAHVQADQHHAEVGAYLLALWGFPSHIVAAVALHHKPSQRPDTGLDLTVLIHAANRLTLAGDGTPAEPATLGIEPEVLERLGLVDHLPEWLRAVGGLDADPKTTSTTPT